MATVDIIEHPHAGFTDVLAVQSADGLLREDIKQLQCIGRQTLYCLAKLDENNHVIEHVLSRPEGNNSYRNVVAACRRCNNRKSASDVEDFIRSLYREGILSGEEFSIRMNMLGMLRNGDLCPLLP